MINERLNNLKKRVEDLSYKNRPLIIWGMGGYAAFISRSLNGIEKLKIEAFTDNISGGVVNMVAFQQLVRQNA